MPLRIAVFGLGYVGCVSAACLARDGHTVVGVDVQREKVEALARGVSPIVEPGLEGLLQSAVAAGRLTATLDVEAAVRTTDVAIICVGTPSLRDGAADLSAIERVCSAIGLALAHDARNYTVLLRSTVPPGTTETMAIPTLGRSSSNADRLIVGFHPEFLREASAIDDYDNPARIVVGCDRQEAADVVGQLYPRTSTPVTRTEFKVAELLKYTDNSFHALKTAFANEVGTIARALGVNGTSLMSVFVQDTKLNISPAYLRPGGAFGGSCLPKDLRSLVGQARKVGVDAQLLRGIIESNEHHKRRAFEVVKRHGKKRVAVLGLAFKPGIDDLRESPAVELTETLIGKGYEVSVFDPSVNATTLVGSNRTYIERELPHLHRLLRPTLEETVGAAEIVIITSKHPSFATLRDLLRRDHIVVDLVGLFGGGEGLDVQYEGICW